MTNQKYTFAIEDLDIIDGGENSEFATLSIKAFADGKNLHETYVSEETLRKTAPTIREKPLVWMLDKRFQDAGSHDDMEIPCGFIPADSPLSFEKADDGTNRTFLVIIGKIWKKYSGQILDFFARDDMTKSVSVEIDPLEVIDNLELNMPEIKNFVYNCITILGDLVQPAIKGARADIIAFAKTEKQEYLKVYSKEFSKYDELDLSVPKKVKDNCMDALQMYGEMDENERSAQSISLAIARHLTKNSKVTLEKFRQIQKYAPKNFKNNDLNSLLFGGSEGKEWLDSISEKLAELDNRRAAYFNVGGDMPKLKDDFAKEDLGKGPALKVDKSKEKLSQRPWGEVNKTILRNKILNASNYKSIVDDVYMKVESGWEDHPSSSLGYPVMELDGDTLVYNRYGLSAALQRAEGQNETSVISKVKSIYTKMGLDKPEETEKKEDKKLSMSDKKDEKEFADETTDVDMAAKPTEGSPEEEKTETPSEEKKEDKKEQDKEKKDGTEMSVDENVDMSAKDPDDDGDDDSTAAGDTDKDKAGNQYSDQAYMDVAAALAFLKAQTDANQEIADEYRTSMETACMEMSKEDKTQYDFAKICAGLYAYGQYCNSKMTKMSDEMMSLKEFKATKDSEEFTSNVTATMAEVKDVLPENDFAEMLEESKKYSVANITTWQNLVRAKALPFALQIKPKEDGIKPIQKIGLLFDTISPNKKGETGLLW